MFWAKQLILAQAGLLSLTSASAQWQHPSASWVHNNYSFSGYTGHGGTQPSPTPGSSLPIVDLGYNLQRANYFNDTGNYYNFSNIRFAAPPTGNLRFRAPQAPAIDRSKVFDGSEGGICAQAIPAWILTLSSSDWISRYLSGLPINITIDQVNALNDSINASTISQLGISLPDGRQSEDCLFLDVIVSKSIWEKKDVEKRPVLVWIYGGGYIYGDKGYWGNPAHLIAESERFGLDGVIWVGINYRLGAFGWLAGPSLQADGTANAGLYDQKLALEWVQEHIHLFGGDKDQVTVCGESAGGGSIMHHLTAYGGHASTAPFKRIVAQSPAWQPLASSYVQETTFQQLLLLANVTSLEGLRSLTFEQLNTAQTIQIGKSAYSTNVYGPVVDGDYVPADPKKLILQGSYNRDVEVMTGHNTNEGLLFTNPFAQSTANISSFLQLIFPTAAHSVIDYIVTDLYPPPLQTSLSGGNYTDETGRLSLLIAEMVLTCNAHWMDRAYRGSHGYVFNVPPGLHAQDVPYTFYNPGPHNSLPPGVVNSTVATALQEYITSFAQTGAPRAAGVAGVPAFQAYGPDARVLELGVAGVEIRTDPAANKRCEWWAKQLYA